MGLCQKDLQILINLKEKGYISNRASIIEIGAQQLSNQFLLATEQLNKISDLFGVPRFSLPAPLPTKSLNGIELLNSHAPQASLFWESIGLSYSAIDIDETPNSIPLDLNYDEVPFLEQGKYHVVTNYGTTEHVANQLNAFKIIHDLTALGGIMIHSLPTQGMPNHGLVNYNPKFFWMLARSNGYHWVYMDYTQSLDNYRLPQNIADQIIKFNPQFLHHLENYKISDAGLFIVLQKKYNTQYVAPLDVNTGTKTNNRSLCDRYWSVFNDNAFALFN
jgi:2-polyprenyl-3-methyl-5-hydroxy-6-metoxy-1,4-benzoquinol methylase